MTLYEECLLALSEYEELSDDIAQETLDIITKKIPFTWYERVDINKVRYVKSINSFEEISNILEKEAYVFWDVEKHIIKSKIKNIINAWEEVEALGTRTWIVSTNFDFFIEFYDEMILGIL